MTSGFDSAASSFERCRPLPADAPAAIRSAICAATGVRGRVLDLGAGTGRIGRAFIAAGDCYIAVDASLAMLREFLAASHAGLLLQADGRRLPFCDHVFDLVLLMQVLSGADDWRGILEEVRRVLRAGGWVVVGHVASPESGIDARLKTRLNSILEQMRVPRRPQDRRGAVDWLEASAVRRVRVQAASWMVTATAREFLMRHRTGARFAALPLSIQDQALEKLRGWSEATFGSIDAGFEETRSFELDLYEF